MAAAVDPAEPQVTAEPDVPSVTIIAERAAWVRIYLQDKTVIFERILESGETYDVPQDAEIPLIWAGNSGSVYVKVGSELRGPIGTGTRAVRDLLLNPETLAEQFAPVSEVPAVLSEALAGLARPQAEAALAQ
jgi:hypothetical protein